MVVGIIIAIPPLSGDIKWREAIKAQSADLVTVALTPSYMSPASSNLYINATQIFEQNNLPVSWTFSGDYSSLKNNKGVTFNRVKVK